MRYNDYGDSMAKHIAFIGSSSADVIMRLPHLPTRQEDISIQEQTLSLGGCAFNAFWMCRLMHGDPILFSPVGTGIYGDFVRKELQRCNVDILLPVNEENGCCYCLVEDDGERTFLAYHKAEYQFQEEWFSRLDAYPIDTVYVCGLEIEEESGIYIVEYLQKHPEYTIYFAPGPRLAHIDSQRMQALFSLHCILHLNEEEALQLSKAADLYQAAKRLYEQSQNSVVITMGDQGCLLYDKGQYLHIPGIKTKVVDTIGAGDAHIGSIIALRAANCSWEATLVAANRISANIVSIPGSLMTQEEFDALSIHLHEI